MPILPLKNILTEEKILELASRSNFRLGKQIFSQGDFKVNNQNIFHLNIEVKYKTKNPIADLLSNHKGLKFSCSCSAKKNNFCEHLVVASLYIAQ